MEIVKIISEHKKARPFWRMVNDQWVKEKTDKIKKGFKRVEAIMSDGTTRHLDVTK